MVTENIEKPEKHPTQFPRAKGADRIQINNFMGAVSVGVLAVLLGLSEAKFSLWTLGQLAIAIPCFFTSSLAYSKVNYRHSDECPVWDRFGWITHSLGYIATLNAIALLLYHSAYRLVSWILIVTSVFLFVAYSITAVVLEPRRRREKSYKLGFYLLLIIIGCILPIVARWTPSGRSKTNTVRIGASLPLTGDAAVYGRAIKQGMDLAADEIQRNKGMDLDIVYEDDQGKPTASVSSVNKLLTVDKVAIIVGGAMSSTAEPIIPLTERNQVILISPTATKASLTDNTHYFFRLWPSDNYDGRIMAELAYTKLGLRRVAVSYVNVSYGLGIAEVFKREFQSLGGTIVAFEGYAQGATDFRTQIEKLRASRPDAVYIPGYVKEVASLLRQAKELDFKPRFLGVNSLHDPALLETAGDSAEGAVFTCPTYDAGDSAPPVADFVAAFKEKYGNEPDAFAAQGYDAVRVIAKAITLGGGASAAQVRKGLLLIKDYTGPSGKVTFEPTGDVQKPLRLLTVKKGRFMPL